MDKSVIGHGIKKLSCLIDQDVRQNMNDCSTSSPFLLVYLAKHGGMIPQSEIEKKFSVRRSTVTSNLQTLEKDGFIERKESIEDKRQKNIVLTEKGMNFCKKLKDVLENNERKILNGFTDGEIEELSRLLNKAIDNLEGEVYEKNN